MNFYTIASFACLAAALPSPSPSTSDRIIGGTLVAANKNSPMFPFMTYLEVELGPTSTGNCGGSLVSSNMIVTAAHCLSDILPKDPKKIITLESAVTAIDSNGTGPSLRVRGGTSYTAIDYLVHPNYDAKLIQNDIAVIYVKIDQNFLGDGNTPPKPIAIATTNASYPMYTATGFGLTRPEDKGGQLASKLWTVQLAEVSQADCAAAYRGNAPITGKNVCAGSVIGLSTCNGDSGGPLFTTAADGSMVLVGLTSWGDPECDFMTRTNSPSVFTRLSAFTDFLVAQQAIADTKTGIIGVRGTTAATSDTASPVITNKVAGNSTTAINGTTVISAIPLINGTSTAVIAMPAQIPSNHDAAVGNGSIDEGIRMLQILAKLQRSLKEFGRDIFAVYMGFASATGKKAGGVSETSKPSNLTVSNGTSTNSSSVVILSINGTALNGTNSTVIQGVTQKPISSKLAQV